MKKISTLLVITMIASMLNFAPTTAAETEVKAEYGDSYGEQLTNAYAKEIYNTYVSKFIYAQNDEGNLNGTFTGLAKPVDGDAEIIMDFSDVTLNETVKTEQEGMAAINQWAGNMKAYLDTAAIAATDAFLKDYPQVYWMSGASYNTRFIYQIQPYTDRMEVTANVVYKIVPTLCFDGADTYIEEFDNEVIATKQYLIQKNTITPATDDTYLAFYIHNYIIEKCTFNEQATEGDGVGFEFTQTPLPVFIDNSEWNNSIVCEGYAKAFKILGDVFGLDTAIVNGYGVVMDGSYKNHMWNLIKIDGLWYGVDLTWDDQETKTYHSYFICGMTTEGFHGKEYGQDHIVVGSFSNSQYSTDFKVPQVAKSGYFDDEETTTTPKPTTQAPTTQKPTTQKPTTTTPKPMKISVSYAKSYVYTGKAIKSTVSITCNGVKLKEGTDYSVSYSNNIKVGTAKGVVTFKGKYAKIPKYTFTYKITKANASKFTYSGLKIVKDKNGKYSIKTVTYKFKSTKLKLKSDYTVAYKWSKKSVKITLTGKGNFTGKKVYTIKLK